MLQSLIAYVGTLVSNLLTYAGLICLFIAALVAAFFIFLNREHANYSEGAYDDDDKAARELSFAKAARGERETPAGKLRPAVDKRNKSSDPL